ncbi:pectinesterase-like [Wolffia australiana]
MDYGKLVPSESFRAAAGAPPAEPRRRWRLVLGSIAAALLIAAGAAVGVVFLVRPRAHDGGAFPKPSVAISRACASTLYPALCVSSLVEFPGAIDAPQSDLAHIAVNATLRQTARALARAAAADAPGRTDPLAQAAYEDCLELMGGAAAHLDRALAAIAAGGAADDVRTWLSAALTNHDTCAEGLAGLNPGRLKEKMEGFLEHQPEMASNSLAIFAASDAANVLNRRRRRLLAGGEFPAWVGGADRVLLESPAAAAQADIVVAKDGTGRFDSIQEAVDAAPVHSPRRFIIYVKAGRYEETVKVARKKTNLMFIGDGQGKTVVSGNLNVLDHLTTFRTATFAATGEGFMSRDMSFENTAGPAKHQAVALRVGADRSVVYRCAISGYQDTLYAHSLRQFYRDCTISGTVDFIFGNAAAVLQNCVLLARKPMGNQRNTITAQGRKDPNQNTGFSIHDSRILPAPELGQGTATFLGRPWKTYSRVVFMLSYIAGHVDPAGWLEWNGDFALDTLYYGEYMNTGPGAGVGKRVKWPGVRVITMEEEAEKFTVGRFIGGTSWLPSTGVAFVAGLT